MQDKILIALIVANFIAVVFLLFNNPIPIVDEGVYVSMGKYIFSNGEFGYLDDVRAFGLPLILGFFWFIGVNPLLVGKFISIASWFLSSFILLKFRNLLRIKNYIAPISLLFFINLSIYYTKVLTDSIAMFFALISLFYLFKRDFLKCGIFLGLSMLVRFTSLSYLVAFTASYIVYSLTFGEKKFLRNFLKIVIISTLFFSLNFIFSKIYFDSFFHVMNQSFRNRIENMWYGDSTLLTHLSFIIFSPLFVSLLIIFSRLNKKNFLIVLTTIFISLIFFTFPPSTREERFFLQILPFLSLTSSIAFENFRYKKIVLIFIIFLIVFFLTKNLYFILNLKQPEDYKQIYVQVGKEIYVKDAKKVFTNDLIISALYDVSLKPFGNWKYGDERYEKYKPVDLAILDFCSTPCDPRDELCKNMVYHNRTIEAISKDLKLRTKLSYRNCEYLIYSQ